MAPHRRRPTRRGAASPVPGARVSQGVEGPASGGRGKPIAHERGPVRLNAKTAGASGRRKLCFADWDGDGLLDLLINGRNVDLFRGVPAPAGEWAFKPAG